MTIEKLSTADGQSKDLLAENIEQLKRLFPEVITEGPNGQTIDFDHLRRLLGDQVEESEERFGLTWHGKARAKLIAQQPSTGTLRPMVEGSVNWDTTQNLFIEGDNLEVLKLLQKSYHQKVKMIYIDPPYNTGKEFIYPDKFDDNLDTYLRYTGQKDADGRAFGTNTETSGRYHTNWLNMIYPRLKLARNLLREDGCIFISIDDHEVDNLRLVCDEVFGEANCIAQICWAGGRKNDSRLVSVSHEYVLCYVKSAQHLSENDTKWRQRKKGLDDIYAAFEKIQQRCKPNDFKTMERELKQWYSDLANSHPAKAHKHYCRVDHRGIYFAADISWPGGGGPKYQVLHPETGRPVAVPSRGWMFSKPERMQEAIDDDRVHFGDDETSVPCIKSYLRDREYQAPYSVLYQDGRAATKRLRKLMGASVFDHPKDENVLAELFEFATTGGGLCLDFFAGSASSAHALMKLSADDKVQRRWISIQLPETLSDKSKTDRKALKKGYKTIADIGRHRVIKAGRELQDSPEVQNLDAGFRALSLDSSNLNLWIASTGDTEQMSLPAESLKPDRSELDIVFEILLKTGLDLSLAINEHAIAGRTVHEMGAGALIVCLAKAIDLELVEGIAALHDELAPEVCRVVFRDSGFADDATKTNAVQILKRHGIEDVKSL